MWFTLCCNGKWIVPSWVFSARLNLAGSVFSQTSLWIALDCQWGPQTPTMATAGGERQVFLQKGPGDPPDCALTSTIHS